MISEGKIAEQQKRQDEETARLKVLWDKENAVDKGARRAAAEKAAAEKEAHETPSPEDQARGKEIFDAVHNRWNAPHKHRLLLADDGTVHKHVFTLWITHPFRKSAWERNITLPAERFGDKTWCIHTVDLALTREWASMLEEEAADQRRHAENIATQLQWHEEETAPKPEPPKPEPIDISRYEGLSKLSVGFEFPGMITAKLVSIDKATGDLKLLILDHGVDSKHVLAGKEYTFEIHNGDTGDTNLWSLRDEEHECWNDTGHDADLLLYYNKGTWDFDLDS